MFSSGLSNTMRFRIVLAMISVAIVSAMLTVWLSSRTVASRFEAYLETVALAADTEVGQDGDATSADEVGSLFPDGGDLTPEENFLTAVNRNYLYGVLLAILVCFLISVGVVQNMVSPLEKLLAATRLLALGEYDAKVEIESEDEIRELNDLINHMADKLADASSNRRQLVNDIVGDLEPMANDGAVVKSYLDELTLLNQVEARELVPNFRAVPLYELLDMHRDRVAEKMAAKGVALEFDVTDRLPSAKGDWEMSSQVIGILLNNAIDFAPKGSTVTISSKRSRSEITLQFEDEGVQLGMGDLDKIFEPYYRAEERNGPAGHTGPKLALAAQFVLTMEGRIWARSQRSGGTLFAFALPLAD